MLSASCWSGVSQGVALLSWSGWSTKVPVDYHDHNADGPSEAHEAGEQLTKSSVGDGEDASNAADTGSESSDAIRAVLMYHLRAPRLKVRAALEAAVKERSASRILDLCREAGAVGVPQTEIDEAVAAAAEICATFAYETVMHGGSAADIIRCLAAPHLSAAQTAQLEMKLGEEVFALTQQRDWRRARDLLRAARTAGVSTLRDEHGERSIGLIIMETYADEAMEEADADAISEACAALEGVGSDRDLSEMRARVQQIRGRTASVPLSPRTRRCDRSGERISRCDAGPDGSVALGKEVLRWRPLRLSTPQKGDDAESPPSVSTVASASDLAFCDDTAAAG
jgi:hypothetical protein